MQAIKVKSQNHISVKQYLSKEVISADQVPVPHLHTEKAIGQCVVQLKFKTLIPAWIAGLLYHLEECV